MIWQLFPENHISLTSKHLSVFWTKSVLRMHRSCYFWSSQESSDIVIKFSNVWLHRSKICGGGWCSVASPAMDSGARAPSTSNDFIFSLLWSKSESQLSEYCVVCEISWCRCRQLTASSFDQYCIRPSHRTISHRAAAALGPEVHR